MNNKLESEIKRECKKDLEKWGWMVIHLIQTNRNGIPDTLILRNGRCVFIEFKRPTKEPRELQEYRISKIRKQGIEVYVVKDQNDIAHLK